MSRDSARASADRRWSANKRRSAALPPALHVWHRAGTIGTLETQAGITDRAAFWLPFAKFDDGFQRGVAELRRMIEVAS